MKQAHQIKFEQMHNLGIYAFDASDVELFYGKFYLDVYVREEEDDPRDLAPSKRPEDEERIRRVTIGGLPVFRGPVTLKWHDLHDNPIEYRFRFEDLFPDKVVPYDKALEDKIYWDKPISIDPGIVIEIINRQLNIYAVLGLNILKPGTTEVAPKRSSVKVFSKEF